MTHSFARLKPALVALSGALLVASCGGGDDGDGTDVDGGQISASCMEATTKSDLGWIQDNIFSTSCAAFSSCHQGTAAGADGLNLETGNSEASLVGIDSMRDSRYKLVNAGSAGDSYLLMIMGRNPDANDVTVSREMPLANPNLCDEKLEAVARWVDSL